MPYRYILTCFVAFISLTMVSAQSVTLEGYVYESGNRGYLNQVRVEFENPSASSDNLVVFSDENGFFTADLSRGINYKIVLSKDLFNSLEMNLSTETKDNKLFIKTELIRAPGYIFDITLAHKSNDDSVSTNAIKGARIEVFNNTTDKEELNLVDYQDPNFQFNLYKGNHYTVMIRKEGYLTKRMEAYVNVGGCVLCFDGIGTVAPEVSDNLTDGLNSGTMLANVELEPVSIGSKFVIDNIYYDYEKSFIRPDAAIELDKLVSVLKDNPGLIVELGSHTDARGKDEYNMTLSEARAKSAVEYLARKGLPAFRISSKGYGETELVNDCINDVECTEEEHQENRRTELKVLGLTKAEEMARKSLAKIIREEKFLQESFENAEVVEYKEGEEIPDDLRKFIDEQKINNSQEETTEDNASVQESVDEEVLVEENIRKESPDDVADVKIQNEKSVSEEVVAVHKFDSIPADYKGYSVIVAKGDIPSPEAVRTINELGMKLIKYQEDSTAYWLVGTVKKLTDVQDIYLTLKKSNAELESSNIVLFRNGEMIK